jgi:hypothetical protein
VDIVPARTFLSFPAAIGLTVAAAATLVLGILPGQVLQLAQRAGTTSLAPVEKAAMPSAEISK